MQNCKGTSTNIVFRMMLLFIFSMVSLALAFSATGAFRDIEADKENISELMVALSYLNMKVRQNDSVNAIRTEPCPSREGQAIVITETLDSVAYETWIYWHDGQLKESFILKGDPAVQEASSLIAEIDGFRPSICQLEGTPGKVKIHVWCNSQGKPRDLTLNLSLRASQLDGL